MSSPRLFALEPAPEVSLRQLYALAQIVRHVEAQRRRLGALRDEMAHAIGAAAGVGVIRPRTLLVADDHPVVRAITRELVQALGHTAIVADGDFRGVVKAGVDAVLLDVAVVTERELAWLRRARRWSSRLLVATPLPEGAARDRLRAAGATAFVGKPFHPLTLARAIQEVTS